MGTSITRHKRKAEGKRRVAVEEALAMKVSVPAEAKIGCIVCVSVRQLLYSIFRCEFSVMFS